MSLWIRKRSDWKPLCIRTNFPANICLFLWHRSGVFIVNFEHISRLFSSVSIVEFEQVKVSWDVLVQRCFVSHYHGAAPKFSSRGVLWQRCSENVQQICRRISMPKYDFSSCFVNLWHISEHLFLRIPLDGCFWGYTKAVKEGKQLRTSK